MSLSLADALRALLAEDAWEARVRVEVSGALLLVLRRPGEGALWLEVWPEGDPRAHREALSELGLRRRRFREGGKTFGLALDPEPLALDPKTALPGLLARIDRILSRVRTEGEEGDPADSVTLAAQREPPPQNPLLVEAMRAAASQQDSRTRQQLYAALVNATLLVPLDPATADRPEHEQRPLTLSDGRWAAFSDWEALRQWSPAGHPFGLVHGTDLFAHAADRSAGVAVNPGGVVGGELYPLEVQMMAEAVRGYLRKHSS